jgi:squalene monooxygenase
VIAADVLVAGAGPGGCAAALALARAGRRVVLVGPRGSPDRGLSGEWLHPAGVATLRRLGVGPEGAEFTENLGFVLHPGPGQAPVVLPYRTGHAVSMRHHVLVDLLRAAAAGHPRVTLSLGDRVTAADADGSAVTGAGTVHVGLVVGADGRASLVRRALLPDEPPAPTLSATAGFELTGAQLPTEQFGHVFLGGPGPALAYRIGPGTIRLLLDVAPRPVPPAELVDHLLRCYAPALPENLRAALRESARRGSGIRWAANRFRGRRYYGHGRRALVGDAVGFGHPLAALGMTMAILDAECLARRGDVPSYTRERRVRSWAPERLGMALHRAMTGTDIASVVLREALVHLWRHDEPQRDRMMRLLAVQEEGRTEFGLAVTRIAATALAHIGRHCPHSSGRNAARWRIATTIDLADWLLWLYRPAPRIPPTPR